MADLPITPQDHSSRPSPVELSESAKLLKQKLIDKRGGAGRKTYVPPTVTSVEDEDEDSSSSETQGHWATETWLPLPPLPPGPLPVFMRAAESLGSFSQPAAFRQTGMVDGPVQIQRGYYEGFALIHNGAHGNPVPATTTTSSAFPQASAFPPASASAAFSGTSYPAAFRDTAALAGFNPSDARHEPFPNMAPTSSPNTASAPTSAIPSSSPMEKQLGSGVQRRPRTPMNADIAKLISDFCAGTLREATIPVPQPKVAAQPAGGYGFVSKVSKGMHEKAARQTACDEMDTDTDAPEEGEIIEMEDAVEKELPRTMTRKSTRPVDPLKSNKAANDARRRHQDVEMGGVGKTPTPHSSQGPTLPPKPPTPVLSSPLLALQRRQERARLQEHTQQPARKTGAGPTQRPTSSAIKAEPVAKTAAPKVAARQGGLAQGTKTPNRALNRHNPGRETRRPEAGNNNINNSRNGNNSNTRTSANNNNNTPPAPPSGNGARPTIDDILETNQDLKNFLLATGYFDEARREGVLTLYREFAAVDAERERLIREMEAKTGNAFAGGATTATPRTGGIPGTTGKPAATAAATTTAANAGAVHTHGAAQTSKKPGALPRTPAAGPVSVKRARPAFDDRAPSPARKLPRLRDGDYHQYPRPYDSWRRASWHDDRNHSPDRDYGHRDYGPMRRWAPCDFDDEEYRPGSPMGWRDHEREHMRLRGASPPPPPPRPIAERVGPVPGAGRVDAYRPMGGRRRSGPGALGAGR